MHSFGYPRPVGIQAVQERRRRENPYQIGMICGNPSGRCDRCSRPNRECMSAARPADERRGGYARRTLCQKDSNRTQDGPQATPYTWYPDTRMHMETICCQEECISPDIVDNQHMEGSPPRDCR